MVVPGRSPIWAIFVAIILVILVVAFIIFLISGGRGTVFVVAIPGFPVEFVILGVAIGVLFMALKRRRPKTPSKR